MREARWLPLDFTAADRLANTHCLQFARSSSDDHTDHSGDHLTYIPFATDAVSYATLDTSNINRNLTVAQQQQICNCTVTTGFTVAAAVQLRNPEVLVQVTPAPTPAPEAVKTVTRLSVIRVPLPFHLGGFMIPIAIVTPLKAAGTVQLFDDDTPLGGSSPEVSGVVIGPFGSLGVGKHSVTAVFTPTDPGSFLRSTSKTVKFTFYGIVGRTVLARITRKREPLPSQPLLVTVGKERL